MFSAPVVRLLNALLSREAWARDRLRPHAGKTVRLVAGGFDWRLTVTSDGRIDSADVAVLPNVTLTVEAGQLPRLLSAEPAERMQAVRIDGEAALAQVVADLARDLRWDVEDDLSRLMGDAPALRLSSAVRRLGSGARTSASRLLSNTAEYLTHESRAVAERHALADWRAQVARMVADTDALAARVARLEARLDAAPRALPPPERAAADNVRRSDQA